jgi:hypothetical protein
MFSGHGLRALLQSQRFAWKASYGRILRFHRCHGRWPNLLRPQTFNEKILYRSIYDRRELFHVLSDKLAVRDYVRERAGDAVATPKVLFSTRSPELLLTVPLPRYFVMKSNHGQGHTYMHGRADVEVDRRRLAALGKKWLKYDNYERRGQWCYKGIEKMIFVEEHLSPGGPPPDDYKFFCFDGVPRMIEVGTDRFSGLRRAFYNPEWHRLEFAFVDPPIPYEVRKPPNLEQMLDIAGSLARGLDFIRVDLYDLGDRVAFGEMTCMPQNGCGRFTPASWDLEFGRHWHLACARGRASQGSESRSDDPAAVIEA